MTVVMKPTLPHLSPFTYIPHIIKGQITCYFVNNIQREMSVESLTQAT
jgi:hypothetical protein